MNNRKLKYPVLYLAVILAVGNVCISKANAEYEQVPILMVHGLFGNSSAWNELKTYLTQNGYDETLLYAIDITIDNGALCSKAHVTEISNKVEQIVSESGFERIDVIGHSRGSLNLYNYMRFDNGANRVRNWISLSGANNACPTLYGEYPEDPTPGDTTEYTSIWSKGDVNVSEAMATIVGARMVELFGLSHSQMLNSSEIVPSVLEALQGNGLNDGSPYTKPPSAPIYLRIITPTDLRIGDEIN